MWYSYLADVVLAFHVAYVAFVVLGQLAIPLGIVLGWQWVRNVWFRLAHLAAIGFVALQAVLGILCPLTVWEDRLRSLAAQQVSEGSFIGRCLRWVLFYDLPPWAFTALYVGFFLLVLATLALAPPRVRKAGRSPAP